METGAGNGMLLLEKESWKDEEVQEMVRREGFHKVEETDDYVVLLPPVTVLDEDMSDENVQHQDGYKSIEDIEEEMNVITTCAAGIVDFEIYDWGSEAAYRAGPASAEQDADLTQPGGMLYAADWELSGDRKLEDVGLKCLRLEAELLSEVSAPAHSLSDVLSPSV